jgi:RsiW-degrading membrane proteinase PrsW (M82 family)
MNKHNRSQNKSLRLSHMLPIIGTKGNLWQKGFLIPGIVTVLVVVGLYNTQKQPESFNNILSIYLAVGAYYAIYQLCGKYKPWWLLVGCAATTYLLLRSGLVFPLFSWIFRDVLPGQIPKEENLGFITMFVGMFFGAGMCEELFKVLPVFLALGIGTKLKSPWRERIGIWEPLDGILLATASAVGFTLLETLLQYVPQAISGTGELSGLQLLIPRIVGSVAGHMAYSGYFGYFIGLSVLKPSKRWQILAIGYLTASTLHALWNSAALIDPLWAQALAGVLGYAFLMAAILKARELSPTRSQNWATQYLNPPPPPPLPPPAKTPFSLSIQQRLIPLGIGTQLQAREIPGLGAKTRGVVAEVNAHPQDPNILGLKNCSHQVWTVTLPNGQQTRIDPDRSLKLATGTRINFGSVTGEIQ